MTYLHRDPPAIGGESVVCDSVYSLSLAALYQEYIERRRKTVSPSTWKSTYLVCLSTIKRSPLADINSSCISLKQAQEMCEWVISHSTPDTARRTMMQVNACYNWAIDLELVSLRKSPFNGLASKVKKQYRSAMSRPMVIEFFTIEERDAIIKGFQESKVFSHYYNYVRFGFFTGCRPSEAIGLRWSDVAPGFTRLTFKRAVIVGERGRQIVSNKLKTQKNREFPCNDQVREILTDQKSTVQSELVFPSVKGGFLNRANFQSRAWKSVLSGQGIGYRKPYCMRHTYITMLLKNGLEAKEVARLVGNSADIIYRYYAGCYPIIVPAL